MKKESTVNNKPTYNDASLSADFLAAVSSVPNPKIGLLPGTFDPLHEGHILLANEALKVAQLDFVLFYVNSFNSTKQRSGMRDISSRITAIEEYPELDKKIIVIPNSWYADFADRDIYFKQEDVFLPLIYKLNEAFNGCEVSLIRGSDNFAPEGPDGSEAVPGEVYSYPNQLCDFPHVIGVRDIAHMSFNYTVISKNCIFVPTNRCSSTALRKVNSKQIESSIMDEKFSLITDLYLLAKHALHSVIIGGQKNGKYVIAIAGPGAVGKTEFAKNLKEYLLAHNCPSVIYEIDNHLIPKSQRKLNRGIPKTGYDPEAYELEKATDDLRKLTSGKSINISPYNMATSEQGESYVLKAENIILLVGSMALLEPFFEHINFSVYLDATETVLLKNRILRESKFGKSEQDIREKFYSHMRDLNVHVAPQKNLADWIMTADAQHRIIKIECA
jgi:cytidyltransferase-like protein